MNAQNGQGEEQQANMTPPASQPVEPKSSPESKSQPEAKAANPFGGPVAAPNAPGAPPHIEWKLGPAPEPTKPASKTEAAEKPAPAAAKPAPKPEVAPPAEKPTPAAAKPTPKAEVAPPVEKPTPAAAKPTPAAEVAPPVEKPTPAAAKPTPAAEVAPPVEKPAPAAAKPTPKPDVAPAAAAKPAAKPEAPPAPAPKSEAAARPLIKPAPIPKPKSDAPPPFPGKAPAASPDAPKKRKRGLLGPVVAVTGVAVILGGTYLALDPLTELLMAPVDSAANKPPADIIAVVPAPTVAPAPAPVLAPSPAPTPAPEPAKAEPARSEPAAVVPAEPEKPAAAPEAASSGEGKPDSAEAKIPAAEPAAEPVARTDAPAPAATAAPAEPVKPAEPAPATTEAADANLSMRERALVERLTETRSQLADTQAQVAELNQRLSVAETKISAPKSETRTLSALDAGQTSAAPSARLVLAQSALTALSQGLDAAVFIGGLERMGADAAAIAQMRTGLAAPTPSKLASDFDALSEKIVAAAEPAPQPAAANAKPWDKALSYVQTHASKYVKVRPIGSAALPGETASALVAKAKKSLAAGDLAGAAALVAQLPQPSRAVAADWAQGANARLAAEGAARAEFEAALKSVGKANN